MKKEPVMWAFSPLYSLAWAQLDCGRIVPIESDGSGEAYDIISTERLMQTREAIDRFLANPITGKIKALNCQVSTNADNRQEQTVYLMRNKRNGFTKIGIARDPAFRERTLQSQEPEIEMLFSIQGTRAVEQECHRRFKNQRVRGEWFDLSDSDIEECKLMLEGKQ